MCCMSVNMDEMDMGTDYSDFEYQHFIHEHQISASADNSNARSAGISDFEPLDTIGGLDNNEVAELVGYRLQAVVEIEDEADDQNTATSVEFRGNFGANLSRAEGISGGDGQGVTVDGEVLDDRAEGSSLVRINKTATDDRIFNLFRANAGLPFDDQTNGPGGSATHDSQTYKENYRDIVGRGPVLDSTDDLSVRSVIVVGDSIITTAGKLRGTLIWDTAEVSDAGRAFSVPR